MQDITRFSPISRAVIVAAAIAIAVFFVQAAASIIGPMLLAAFIAVIATPPLRWLRRKRVPKWLALAVIILALFEAGSLLVLVFTGQLEGFRDGLPNYQSRLILLSDQMGSWLEGLGVDNAREALKEIYDPALAIGLVRALGRHLYAARGAGSLGQTENGV
jgi:AI-2 transport protein TqsA